MDFNSESLPLDFLSLYLGMSTEDMLEENTTEMVMAVENNSSATQDPIMDTGENTVLPGISPSSLSTEGSPGAYIEKTVTELARRRKIQESVSEVASNNVQAVTTEARSDDKSSESAGLLNTCTDEGKETGKDLSLEADSAVSVISGHSGHRIPDYFPTDTSEVEELFDSSGAEEPTPQHSPSTIRVGALSHPGNGSPGPQTPKGNTPAEATLAILGLPKQVSASGRTLLRKYFSDNTPVELPSGHSTVAFNESQVHTLMWVMTEETMISSYDMVKGLLERMTLGGVHNRAQTRRAPRQPSFAPGKNLHSSGEESGGDTTDGYTSGAINTDDDMTGLNSSQCSEDTSRGAYTPTVLGCSPVTDPTSPISSQLLSPGFSSAEYQPLSSIRDQTNDSPTKPNPPR